MYDTDMGALGTLPARARSAAAWREFAACAEADSELFFPLADTRPNPTQLRMALAYCEQCPVRTACLKWAMDSGEQYGIFGGTGPAERVRLRRAHGNPDC